MRKIKITQLENPSCDDLLKILDDGYVLYIHPSGIGDKPMIFDNVEYMVFGDLQQLLASPDREGAFIEISYYEYED